MILGLKYTLSICKFIFIELKAKDKVASLSKFMKVIFRLRSRYFVG